MARAAVPRNKLLAEIKQGLDAYVGREVTLRANKGRKKVLTAHGVLEQTYPNLFVIRLRDRNSVKRLSYTYSDVLTETVVVAPYGGSAEAKQAES
ncbi:MAG: Veg family protein [Firmicutes bacterium]|nr:Veg family protein [Bacillota bacterium]